jgi:hypothetical protein
VDFGSNSTEEDGVAGFVTTPLIGKPEFASTSAEPVNAPAHSCSNVTSKVSLTSLFAVPDEVLVHVISKVHVDPSSNYLFTPGVARVNTPV